MLSPEELVEKVIQISEKKTNYKKRKLLLLGAMAGFFVALGVAARNVSVYSINDIRMERIVSGLFFPVGFMFIIFLGGELFTGNSLMIMGVLDKKIRLKKVFRNCSMVYIGNLIGCTVGAMLINYSGLLNIENSWVGAYMINMAYNKMNIDVSTGFISSILCNIFICLAILLATVPSDVTGKFLLSWLVICSFAIVGFEHIVVNMYICIAGLFARQDSEFIIRAKEIYNITSEQINSINLENMLRNFSIVTIGNMIGGMLIVSFAMYYGFTKKM